MNTTDIAEDYAKAGKGFIETYSGLRFSFKDPVFRLVDIAHALSNTCRYGGHCSLFYSVAEHSVLVAEIMKILGGDPREGLIHDGTEAYLSDVPAPFKQFIPDWKKIDEVLEVQLRDYFNVGEKTKECKSADYIALFIEAYHLMPDQGECFHDPWGLRPMAMGLLEDFPIFTLDPLDAKDLFLASAKYYGITDQDFSLSDQGNKREAS